MGWVGIGSRLSYPIPIELLMKIHTNIKCRYCSQKFNSYISSYAHVCNKILYKKLWTDKRIKI